CLWMSWCVCFFFQAEDGIRDWSVTGVQTCALPICGRVRVRVLRVVGVDQHFFMSVDADHPENANTRTTAVWRLEREVGSVDVREIGRASCREKWRERGAAWE